MVSLPDFSHNMCHIQLGHWYLVTLSYVRQQEKRTDDAVHLAYTPHDRVQARLPVLLCQALDVHYGQNISIAGNRCQRAFKIVSDGVSKSIQFLIARFQVGGVLAQGLLCLILRADVPEHQYHTTDLTSLISNGSSTVINGGFAAIFGDEQRI